MPQSIRNSCQRGLKKCNIILTLQTKEIRGLVYLNHVAIKTLVLHVDQAMGLSLLEHIHTQSHGFILTDIKLQ